MTLLMFAPGLCLTTAAALAIPAGEAASRWPGNEDGLVFIWEDAAAANEVHASGRVLRTCRAEPRDAAKFGLGNSMDLGGGSFVPESVDAPLRQAVSNSGAFAFEALITPPADASARGTIASFGGTFVLTQRGSALQLALGRGGVEITLPGLPGGRPWHVIVAYRRDEVAFYLDGQQAYRGTPQADLAPTSESHLVFGAADATASTWNGRLEAVAVYARFVGAAEATAKHDLLRGRLDKRRLPGRLSVRGRLAAMSAIPDPRSIEPYRRALVVATWELPGNKRRIQVAHWGILDGRVVEPMRRLERGVERALVLEPFDMHDELESERLVNDHDDADLPLHYDTAAVARASLAAPATALATPPASLLKKPSSR
jgi:hypothetical protein